MTFGILFDFNGTLFRDTKEQEQAWQLFAEKYAHHHLTPDDFINHVHGNHNEKVLNYLMQKELDKSVADKYSELKESIYRELCLENPAHFHLIEGAPAFLSLLKAKNVPMTIASAAGKSNFDFYFEHFNLGQWFDFDKIVYDDGSIISKPSPDPYLKAAKKIGQSTENCIIFEDSSAGIQSAIAANAKKIIAISNEGNNAQLAAIPSVSKVIDDFTQVSYEDLR